MSNASPSQTPVRRSWLSFVWRWSKRIIGLMILASLGFAAIAWVLGNTPVNPSFQHASAIDGIEIMVINNGVHVDLVIPVDDPQFRWLDKFAAIDFPNFDPTYRYAMVGWGNRPFYMETETWNDLKISNVLFALAGLGDTVVHVELCRDLSWFPQNSRKIRLSPEQFQRLSDYLLSSFRRRSSGELIPIPDRHYGNSDAFYEGTGHYHLFRTCNVWAGTGLAQAGVRVGYWTLTPDLLFACLPPPPTE
jgi:uncharacterized protein (TIGR02117 family)